MSRLQVGKLSLQCSINVIIQAIKNIIANKSLKGEIMISDKTDLDIRSLNMDDNPGKFNIVIPREIGISSSDIGLKKEANNSWSIKGDNNVYFIESTIMQEVFTMRARAIAEIKNLEIISDEMDGKDKVIRIRKKLEN